MKSYFSKIEFFLDKIFDNKTIKYLGIYLILVFVFYIMSDTINDLIISYLTLNPKLLFQIPNFIFWNIYGVLIIFIIYKFLLKRYQLSIINTHCILICFLLYIIVRFTEYKKGWSFITFSEYGFFYIDLLGSVFFFATILLIVFVINRFFIRKKNIESNIFISDDPITSEKQDNLEYDKRALHIIKCIENAYFKKSFTIGIVGPWGNGKSSFISLIEEKLKDERLKDTIHLKFLPYLNHNEKDIISEFFMQLSSEINKFSGKLSGDFLSYSDKLLKLYKNKNILDFLNPTKNLQSDLSAYDLYQKINNALESLDKKYIIFIDDLDRLSNNEVLQILKLVRNTANFKNFIFVIALDKDYVLETLISKNDIGDHSFVNKFFQLEIYLPEINKSQLKSDFVKLLQGSALSESQNFIDEVSAAIYTGENLFDEYVNNYRDVKRLINQLIFDFNLLPDKLNTNDFLNFTYLKMTFPFAIKYLNRNWQNLIPYNPNSKLCELKEVKNDQSKNDSKRAFDTIDFFKENYNNEPQYSKYEISSNLEKPKEISEVTKFNHTQNLLLSKTLIYLFGKENKNVGHTSIKFENNFRKLIQQKVLETDLDENTFHNIFDFTDNFKNLKTILDKNQVNEVLNRIAYYNSNKQEDVEKVMIVLLFIFNKSDFYQIMSYSVWDILVKFINRTSNYDGISEKTFWKNVKSNYIDKDNFTTEKKIEILSLISEYRIKLNFDEWGIEETELKNLSLDLYKKYIEEKQGAKWELSDYSFYKIYHSVRNLNSSEVINPIVINFWQNNNIELLCAQITGPDAFTIKMLKTSDFASQLFGSKEKYFEFIKDYCKNIEGEGIKEFLQFLSIERITGFSTPIRFEFVEFDLMKKKIEHLKLNNENYRYDGYENVVEMILKTPNEKVANMMQSNLNHHYIEGLKDSNSYVFENQFYTFIRINTGFYHQAKIAIFKHYQENLNRSQIKSNISRDKKSLIIEDSGETVSIYSVEPKSYYKITDS